ncbi:MAG: hypothetical protein SFV54_19400 [Bryobacteraceae bacterium]|nr:hypothetical protein [Bryobacteraceae bacterium]
MNQDRLRRLANRLEKEAAADEALLRKAREVEGERRRAAADLHSLCRAFVTAVNEHLRSLRLELDPDEYPLEVFRDTGVNVIQINARGRLVQIVFESTAQLSSTELFKTPYVLQGSVRWYNQDLIETTGIEEEQVFYCIGQGWKYQNQRNRRQGAFDMDHLMQLMEQL